MHMKDEMHKSYSAGTIVDMVGRNRISSSIAWFDGN